MNKQKQSMRPVWLIVIAIVIILRLIITGDRDILALNSPHDEFWYIQTAINKIWGGAYSQMAFMHLPVYSMWLYFLHLLGIPTRLGIDIGWLLAVGYLAFANYRLTRMAWLATLIFTFLALHPYTITIFDRALAETFLAVVSAAVIGAAIEIWNCRNEASVFRRQVALIVYTSGFAIAFHTRKEGIVLMFPLLIFACWPLYDFKHWWNDLDKKRLMLSLLFAPILSTLFLGAILAGGNYLKWGIWARHELAAPGYERAIGALNSIDVGRTPRYITVTKQVLSLAYKESPTFRELQPIMEGSIGKGWVEIAKPFTSVPGEIGNGWFYWALRDVAAGAGWHAEARIADSKYAAVADELESAFASGRLKKKGIMISSFLEPDFSKWMPELPQSISNVLKLVIQPRLQDLELPRENASASQFERYVMITGRRRMASTSLGIITGVRGWIIMPSGSLVGLGTGDTTYSWTKLLGPERADVPGAYAFAVSNNSFDPPTELHVLSADGKTGSVALTGLKAGEISAFSGDLDVQVGVDSLEFSSPAQRANRWFTKLCTTYDWIGLLFCFAALGGIAVIVSTKKWLSGDVFVFVFMAAVILARVTLFGVLDASSWSGSQARYILPIVPAFACMGSLGLMFLTNLLRKKMEK